MKVTDLMIGDWVSYKNKPVRVEALNKCDGYAIEKDMISIRLTNNTCMGIDADKLEPIRVTNDILRSNDFKGTVLANGDENDAYLTYNIYNDIYLQYYGFEHRLRKISTCVDEWNNHSRKPQIIFECNFHYVHELQHALKLAGVDKEIQL